MCARARADGGYNRSHASSAGAHCSPILPLLLLLLLILVLILTLTLTPLDAEPQVSRRHPTTTPPSPSTAAAPARPSSHSRASKHARQPGAIRARQSSSPSPNPDPSFSRTPPPYSGFLLLPCCTRPPVAVRDPVTTSSQISLSVPPARLLPTGKSKGTRRGTSSSQGV